MTSIGQTSKTSPAGRAGLAERWALRLGAIVWLLLIVGFLLSAPVILDWSALVLVALAVIAGLLALPAAWLIGKVRAGGGYLARWAKSAVALFFLLSIAVAAPIYYLASITEVSPVVVPQVTMTDGQRTLVLQGMMHVGSESFYKSVVFDLEEALADGYTLYYEGVQDGTPEANAWFDRVLGGGGDLSANYKMLGKTCGLQFQLDYFDILAAEQKLHPERHITADVDKTQLLNEFNRLKATNPAFAAANADVGKVAPDSKPSPGADAMDDFIKSQSGGTEGQRKLVGVICRGVMTRLLSQQNAAKPLDPLILDYRNRELAKRIEAETADKIYVTYGAAHFPGVIRHLESASPAWKVGTVKWMRTIQSPRDLKGRL